MSALKLTKLGDFVRLHTVMTPPDFWTKTLREVNRIADQDGEWELMLEERERGLRELRERYYEFANEADT